MDITFEKTEIPKTERMGRPPLPNPFKDVFPSDDVAVVSVVPFDADSVEVRRLIRQARQAAKDVDRAARHKIEVTEEGTKFTAWTVERRAKNSEEDAE